MNPITNFFSAATSRSYKIVTIVEDNSRIAQLGYKVMHSQIEVDSFWGKSL